MNNPEILNPREESENEEQKRELIKLIRSGEALLIVGAGSSKRVGYPDWPELLTELEHLANEYGDGFKPDQERRKKNQLEYAEEIKSHISSETGGLERYHKRLYELFEPRPPLCDDFHKMLVSLPFRGILTTNYDTVLREALRENKKEAERNQKDIPPIDEDPLVIGRDPRQLIHEFLLRTDNDSQLLQRVAHLHGIYRPPESIILSVNDYVEAYGERVVVDNKVEDSKMRHGVVESGKQISTKEVWTLHRKLLWAVLATRRVVFVGFSMKDPYLNKMLETVSEDLWGWNESTHFAIMGISTKNAKCSKAKAGKLKRDYGVGTVFYEEFDNSHQGLVDIIREIAEDCGIEIIVTPMSPEQTVSDAGESEDGLNWLERANRRMERKIGNEN